MLERVAEAAGAFTFQAPAKINLALHVTGRRPDGYHLIETLAVFTRFGDRLTLASADEDSLAVDGPFAGSVPTDDTNLVLRAREILRRDCGGASGPVSIVLKKNLPVASGVGGGSSDAAAALRGLARLWKLDIGEADLARLGLQLGADLPMCLAARPLIARGIGKSLAPVPDFPSLGLVLVNPGVAVSTSQVFGALARRDNPPLPPLPPVIDFHSLRAWLEITRNDLEPAAQAIEPAIGAALKDLAKEGAGLARMSGSGATCFGLFETGNLAERAAAAIRSRHPGWFVTATRSIGWEAEAR